MASDGQQPTAPPSLHKLARRATKGLAWSSVAAATAALALATWRNVQDA